ncbi:NACHT, LRR and PYD domains-containing protein 12-like [Misgurnus anguillicaudatus]|uniref:NACHT, LRR and PYD domains-containing protein 12-like n=1 Tax=Misgurnus anguillicaudatus TaxID=75329 RepID=UPI003CCF0C27
MFQKILRNENIQDLVKDYKDRNQIREAFLNITLHFLRSMKQDEHADKLEDELVYICQLKSNLEKRYQRVFEGITNHGDSTLLNKIYTDLYITHGGGEQINTEHEIRQIEVASRNLETSETQIEFRDLFKPHERDQNIRSVLTKGVAGIGKSFSVQKFVLDWAEGKENQDINIIFPLPFREMNLKESAKLNLMDLISQFFPEITELNLTRNYKKVLFIFDGLDECRLPLKFDSNEILRDVTSPASLDVLLTNLIKGNLFPSALIWITTRPAAAGKIPPECIDRVTEVRGFNDAQKEEYFRKRFTDENMANTIIDHVKKSKSLFIMCHIPVFCWISATVLQNILEKKRNDQSDDTTSEDTPKTLTQMYTHFFRFQIQQSRRKYEGEYSPDIFWDKDVILSLGKLAFQNLEKSNLIFYDSDLEACGIDITKASVYSGMCTQIFKQETGIILGSVYCFVHLSIQEFTAALYAHLFLDMTKKNVFVQEHTGQENNETMIGLLKTAVDKALESDNGHLDLFLRFLLGLSLESNRPLLRGLLTQEESNEQSNKEIVEYIKQKFEDNSSAERSINLFYCLNELNDQSLVKEIQKHLREGSLSSADLSPAQWSALVFVLLTLEEEVEEFELQKFKKSDECLNRLSPVIKTCKQALLNDCNLTDNSCSALAKVLGSDSRMIELNMNNNNLKDDGIKLLCDGLENTKCELKLLRLSDCSIGEEGYVALCSAVRSNPSHLIELDLSGNDPGESGVKLIHDLIQDQNCALKTVRLLKSSSAVKAVEYLSETLGINPLLQRELNLNDHKLQDSILLQICDLLKDKHCRLNTLILSGCGLTEESCSALASVLRSKPGLKELDMSNNNLQDSGVMKLHNGLENTNCQLHKLRLSDCSIGEEGYVALSKAVRSNPSHLIELDLSGNDPGESGVKLIYDLIQDQDCALKKVRLLKSSSAAEVFKYLSETLGINILLQRELNLNDHKLNNTRVKQICDLLKDKHCRLNTLILGQCGLKDEVFAALTSLSSNLSHLRHLDLSGNKLSDTEVQPLCFLLANPQFKLETLGLCGCSITEKLCVKLIAALCSNPSHLRELNLSGNTLENLGVKRLCDLLKHSDCKLEKLKFLKTEDAGKSFEWLSGVLSVNPLLLTKLNLSDKKIDDSSVKQFCDLLKDKNCRFNTFMLTKSCITAEGCADLMSGFNLNLSHIRHLDLSENKLEDSGMKKISHLLTNLQCGLQELRLSDCSITEEGYKALYLAVRSNPSHLKDLDLTGNDPGESGVKLIHDLIQDPNCALKKVRLLKSDAAEEACVYLNEVLDVHPLLVKELNLSDNKLGDLDGEKLSALLMDSHSKVKKIILNDCELTEKQCSAVAALLSCVKEIEMNNSRLMDSGLKQICNELKKPQCQLQILKLSDCNIGEEGYESLSKAVRSNPSHLIELDLSGNDPGESGVKLIYQLIQDQNCALKTVRFLKSSSAEAARQYLNKVVDKEILLQRDLNLNDHKLQDSMLLQICDLLKDKHCRLNTLILSGCGLTEESCSALASVLRSKSGLKELDMSNNNLQDSGVKKLHNGLENTNCQLHKLRLSCCSIGEEGYVALCSAVRSNPSHLKELDLSGNDPGKSGVKLIHDLIQDPKCALKKFR